MSAAPAKRGPCQFARVAPDKTGRVVMRRDAAWPCAYEFGELPPMPTSVRRGLNGFTWPPHKSSVTREDCAECPCWKARDQS